MNQNKKIISLLKKSIEIQPEFSRPYSAISDIFFEKNNFKNAHEYINSAIKIEKKKMRFIKKKINQHRELKKFYMIRKLSENLKMTLFDLAEYLLKKSKILINQNNSKLAITTLKESISYNPDEAEPYFLLYQLETNKKKAQKYLEISIGIDPEYSIVENNDIL